MLVRVGEGLAQAKTETSTFCGLQLRPPVEKRRPRRVVGGGTVQLPDYLPDERWPAMATPTVGN